MPDEPGQTMETRVQASFERMRFMATLGARLATVERGRVVIEVPFRQGLTQHTASSMPACWPVSATARAATPP